VIVAALDSTTPAGTLAVRLPHGDIQERAGDASRGWSARLPGELTALLAEQGLTVRDVDLFAVAAGPGSLTGLRVGMATMQGLALGTARPVVGVSALDALAETGQRLVHGTEGDIVGAWSNAMRGEVFTALYERRVPGDAQRDDPWRLVQEPSVMLPAGAAAAWARVVGDRRLTVVGDIEDPFGSVLCAAFGPRVILQPRPLLGAAVITLALRRLARGEPAAPHALRPIYLRKPDAVLARERAASPAGTAS
jgi:tRNA threonylcarbamoyl adenosine modification protein YeaZ